MAAAASSGARSRPGCSAVTTATGAQAGCSVGSVADVRFTTVHPRGPSKVTGTVTTLSADRLTDAATGAGYYLAYIALDTKDLRSDDLTLTAGLPATVNIRTAKRSFLSYIFAPLLDAFSGAGRQE